MYNLNWQDQKQYTDKEIGKTFSGQLQKTLDGKTGVWTSRPGSKANKDQTTTNNEKGDNEKDNKDNSIGSKNRKLGKGAGKVFAYPLGRDTRDSEDSLLIKAIEYVPPKSGAGLGLDIVDGNGKKVKITKENFQDKEGNSRTGDDAPRLRLKNNSMTDRLRNGFASDAAFKEAIKYYVHLPIPANVNDTSACQWGADTLNFFELAGLGIGQAVVGEDNAVETVQNAVKILTGNVKIPGLTDSTQRAFTAGISGLALNALGSNVSGRSVLSRSTGQILNSNTELLFEGVSLRTFPFDMTFTPRSPEEGLVVKNIIRSFKKSMSARLNTPENNEADGKLFLGAPDLFLIRYLHQGKDHPFLNAFKPCALTQLTTNYTGAGIYSTYNDGTPVQIKLRMVFKEVNPIYQEDYDEQEAGPGVGY
tara:strand:+ start:139 stop:1395 length:1257 start_codon:yes stop_codon:yes gene_type:complete